MRPSDPTIEVVHAAIAFATAAIHGDAERGYRIARRALRQDLAGFLAAVMTTIQALSDEAAETGVDLTVHLQELGLGIHLAALAEQATTAPPEGHDHPAP